MILLQIVAVVAVGYRDSIGLLFSRKREGRREEKGEKGVM
jgi:hypothetical protein